MTTDDAPSNGRPSISDNEIIERFGGIRPMAAKLGVAVTTVQGWKERGHIPGGRWQQIATAAAEHGIDLGDGTAMPAPASRSAEVKEPAAQAELGPTDGSAEEPPARTETAPEPAETQAAAGASPEAREPAAGGSATVAWVALVASIVLTLAVLTRPFWEPVLYPRVAGVSGGATSAPVEQIASEIDRISRAVDRIERESGARGDAIDSRVSALEAGGGEAGAAFAAQLQDLETQIAAFSRTLDELSRSAARIDERLAVLESQRSRIPEPVQKELDGIAGRIERLESVGEDRSAALRERLDGIAKTTDDLMSRVSDLEERPIQTGEKIAALTLAIGQLESALNSGRPYRSALNRLNAIGGDDPVIAESEALAALTPWADQGIPNRLELRRRFREITPRIDRALAGGNEENWLDSVWNSIRGLITIRRVDGTDDVSPVSRAEMAMDRGDLAAAAAAFEGVGSVGPEGDAWLSLVEKRLEAEQEIENLYGRVIAPLAGRGNAGAGTQ